MDTSTEIIPMQDISFKTTLICFVDMKRNFYTYPPLAIAHLCGYVNARGYSKVHTIYLKQRHLLRKFTRENITTPAYKNTPGLSLKHLINIAFKKRLPQTFLKKVSKTFMPISKVVGISVPNQTHLVTAIILARVLKRIDKTIHITFGGPVISTFSNTFRKDINFLGIVDSFILNNGDKPLQYLLEAIEKKSSFSHIPNLIYKDGGKYVKTERNYSPDYDSLMTIPNFKNAPMTRTIPIQFSTGCYWGKCTFCSFKTLNETYLW